MLEKTDRYEQSVRVQSGQIHQIDGQTAYFLY